MTLKPAPQIIAASRQIASARATYEKNLLPLQEASERQNKIGERISALEEQRRNITARRRGGDFLPDDGPNLALIAADLEGIQALLADAEAAVRTLTGPVESARQAIGFAEQSLKVAEDNVAEAALIAHAQHLDGLLLQTATRLAALHKRRGSGMPKWGPSPALAGELRKLQAARQEL